MLKNIDFWSTKIQPEDILRIWWLRAIFSDNRLLNMTFIANAIFSTHFKRKFNVTIKDAMQKNYNEENLIKVVANFFPSPYNDYLINPPSINEFKDKQPEYAIYDEYLDYDDFQESLKGLFRKFNPNPEFDNNMVNLMSIHKSKGLESDYVFITGLVDGVLPNKIRGLDTIEAQRRVLFVGMTRVKKLLYLISQVEWEGKYTHKMDIKQFEYNRKRNIYYGKASSFITEMK